MIVHPGIVALTLVVAIGLAALGFTGCDLPSTEPTGTVIRDRPAEPGLIAEPLAPAGLDREPTTDVPDRAAAAGIDAATADVAQPAVPTTLATPQASAPTVTRPNFHLTAGVAVPVSLSGGTQLAVSVDYRTLRGVNPSTEYQMVVTSSAAETTLAVQLDSSSGTIEGLLPVSVRPEDQPFQARIEERHAGSLPVPASNVLMLRTSY